MRVAIIDLGTNSVRFDLHALGTRGKAKLLHREKLMIRLGQGVFLKGKIEESAMERTLQAFARFERVARALGVRKVKAFGTSALREAQNSQDLIEAVKKSTGIEISVISGREEANLIAAGILAHEQPPSGRFSLLDIGGGSTEISIVRGKKVLRAESFPLGTARLQQVFLKSIPPRPSAIESLRDYVRQTLREKIEKERWPRTKVMIGSSGTVRAIAKILGEKRGFSVDRLSALVADISVMNVSQLMDIEGMEPKRVDMILAGSVLLEEACLLLGVTEVRPTDYSLRDGIFEEQKKISRSQRTSLDFHLRDVLERAVRFGEDEAHLGALVELAETLFFRLRRLHKVPPRWRAYLTAAVALRRSGESVSFKGKEKHSYYVVKHSDFPGLEQWEHEFIARLCLLHGAGKIGPKDLSFLGKDRRKKDAFLRLLALVQLVDALDPGYAARLRLRKVTVSRSRVEVLFGGKGVAGLEYLLTDRKKKLFEESFGRQLWLRRAK